MTAIRQKRKGMMSRFVNTEGHCQPRTRPGQTYPGGKAMRRALASLRMRQAGAQSGNGFTMPGTMQA